MIEVQFRQYHKHNGHRFSNTFSFQPRDYISKKPKQKWKPTEEIIKEEKRELQEGDLFTVFRTMYHSYYGCQISFFICKVGNTDNQAIYSYHNEDDEENLPGWVKGKFEIVCCEERARYANRLIKWWQKGDRTVEYAQLCAKYINLPIRDKEIPKIELEKLSLSRPQPTDAVMGGDAAFQKWLSTAAVLGGKIPMTDD
ncbi:hypothetical protein [Microcoleus sp. B4-D4]|uniref:hypothetical protein n=1 Tax=Microcoleus sp. B4-D4 TaxID=2818667 RepID=UPI002FD163AA